MSVVLSLCTGCARDGLDRGDSYGPGMIIALVDEEDCRCSKRNCDHIDHTDDSGAES